MTIRFRSWPAPSTFGILILPVAIYVGFTSTPLPYLLSKAGVSVYQIGTLGSLLQLPNIFVFLWAPLVDAKLRRQTWLVLSAAATALCLWIAQPFVGASQLYVLTVLLLVAGITVSLVLAASGGLMVTALSSGKQPKAAAWNQAGYLAGGALGGALVLWLVTRLSIFLTGFILALILFLPALIAFTFPEKKPEVSHWFKGRLSAIGREVGGVFKSPLRRWSTILLMAPACTGAAQLLLPAIASHYGVGASGVIWINGLGGGVALGLGSLCGALVPASWDNRVVYVGAGLLNAFAAIVLVAVDSATGYLVGTILYLVTQGLCWARFTALIVEIVGPDTKDASTLYSALSAAGSIPLAYMTWLDGFGYSKLGAHGLLWTDAVGNLIVFGVVVAVFISGRLKFRHTSELVASNEEQSLHSR
ncbi:MAG TPA: MFS transporter [Candidatus Acidoferrales bacterium]|nr:MFS transporter [Candidatus Acidoferrales bacterium]